MEDCDIIPVRSIPLLLACIGAALVSPSIADEVVRIDLASDQGPATYRASGFLHAMSVLEPSAALVDPLKPKLFRMASEDWHSRGAGAWACYGRAKRLGARMQIVISDSHGYHLAWWWPGDNNDWRAWEALVEGVVKRAQAGKRQIEWDIWNEPNLGCFWGRDRDRFFETWKRGFLKIRELDPGAVIVGPSISSCDKAFLEAFLLYCKVNSVMPDMVSWHEMGSPKVIQGHCDQIRGFMQTNGINPRPICINEMIGPGQTAKPGATVIFFAAIERARVDGACHACWNDEQAGISACENESLDGILTHPDRKPRSTWWAYKAYADVTGRLLKLTPSVTVDGVAGCDADARQVRVVLGRDGGEAADLSVAFENLKSVPWLAESGKVRVVAERIAESGWRESPGPSKVLYSMRDVRVGSVMVMLPAFGPNDVFALTLRPAEASGGDTKARNTQLEYSFDIWDWTAPARDLALFEKWAADLKSVGFTRLEMSVPWNLVEPEPGKIDLAFLRERLAICKKHGLGMRLRINSYYSGATPAWYKGDIWLDSNGQPAHGVVPSIVDERFWQHYAPLCTAIARECRGEDVYFNAFIGVHAELKYSDWWTYDASSLALWRKAIKAPRPEWLARVVGNDAPLPETPPIPGITHGTPDSDPANLAFIAFREWCWRNAVARFTKAIKVGDPKARISSPLGESYRRLSAAFSNLDYWGMSRGSDQIVHSYDFFWHPGSTPLWHVRAVIDSFAGITGLPVSFEFDSLTSIANFGYKNDICKAMAREIADAGAGIKIANMSYAQELPGASPVIRYMGEWLESTAPPRAGRPEPGKTVLLFFSKWANYRYREETEWLHDAQFGFWKLLNDLGVPVRVICEDNLTEDLESYKALVLAFSPFDLMPEKDKAALQQAGLPIIADVLEAPKAPPAEPVNLDGAASRIVTEKQSLVVLGFALGYHYLRGADPENCRKIMSIALDRAGVTP